MSDFCYTSKISAQTNDCSWYFGRAYMFESSEVGQCDDCGSMEHVKIDDWHHCSMVASISTNKFHWPALIYLVAMIFKHHFSMSRLIAGIIAFV
jgi:hypothetical protein